MRFFKSTLLAVAALAGLVMAGENPIIYPDASSKMVAGSPFTITWTPTTGQTIKLTLRQGPSNNLHDVDTLVAGHPNDGNFTWTPPTTTPSGNDYAIMITDNLGNINYTPLISIDSDVAPVVSSSSSSSASATKTKASPTAKSSSLTTTSDASSATSVSSTSAVYANTTLITSTYGNATATGNLTLSVTRSATPTSSSESSTSTTASAISTGGASGLLKSPLALVVCVLGAVLYLN